MLQFCCFLRQFCKESEFRMGNSTGEIPAAPAGLSERCSMVVGITHPQTCLVVGPRLRALRRAGFQVTLVCAPGELLEATAADAGVDRVAMPMQRGMSPWQDLVSLLRLGALLWRLRPLLVEFSTPKAGLLGMMAAALCGVPHRVYMMRGLRLETASGWKRRVLIAAERMACACAHVVLCNSESLAARARALRLVPAPKLRVLGGGSSNGVDLDRFSPGASDLRKRLDIGRNAPVIGFVGRLTRDKGVPELIEAFAAVAAKHPEARLLLVGWFDAAEDAIDAGLRARIENHPHIHCTGFAGDTAPYYRAMDVLVLPTWREGFPNVVLEAQASGVPVVTTLSTGSRDSVVPEVTGLLIPPGYPQAIAESVLKLLDDPGRRRRMGRAARAWVREHYVDRRVLDMTVEFYRNLLEETASAAAPLQRQAESLLAR